MDFLPRRGFCTGEPQNFDVRRSVRTSVRLSVRHTFFGPFSGPRKLLNCFKGSILRIQKGVQSVTLLKRKHFGDPKRGPNCDIWTKFVVLKQNKGPKGLWRDLELVDLLHFSELTCMTHRRAHGQMYIKVLRLSCAKAPSGPPCPAGVI